MDIVLIDKCTLYQEECKKALKKCSAEMDCYDCKYMRVVRYIATDNNVGTMNKKYKNHIAEVG